MKLVLHTKALIWDKPDLIRLRYVWGTCRLACITVWRVIFGSGSYRFIVCLHSCWHDWPSGIPQSVGWYVSWDMLTWRMWLNRALIEWVSWPLPVSVITGSHFSAPGVRVCVQCECVPLLSENSILRCWVPHRNSWLLFPCLCLGKNLRWFVIFLCQTVLCILCLSIVSGVGLYICFSRRRGVTERKTDLTFLQWHLVDLQGTVPSGTFCKNNRDPPLRPLSPSLSSLRPSLHPPPFVSPSFWDLPGWFILPASPQSSPFVCVFVSLLVCLHARVWFLYVCVCLYQKSQPHRDERGALGQPAGPGSRWTRTQHARGILPGSGAAPRQTLPGLVLEWGGDHPTGEWLHRPRLHQERLQAVWR